MTAGAQMSQLGSDLSPHDGASNHECRDETLFLFFATNSFNFFFPVCMYSTVCVHLCVGADVLSS